MSYQSPYGQPQDPYRPEPGTGSGFPTYTPPQQGYGAAPQQPQPAPQPYSYNYGQPVYGPRTNTLAIISLITAFFVPLAGIICGHISLGQIRRTGENGRGLAIAGLVIGYLYMVFVVIYIVFVLALVGAASY